MRKVLHLVLVLLVLLSGTTLPLGPGGVREAFSAPSGPSLRALVLDGSTTYIEVSNDRWLNPQDGLTIEAWVYRQSDTRCETVVGKDWRDSYWLGFCPSKIRFYVGGGSSSMYESNATVPAGQWTHVAATYDNVTGRRCFYLNGTLDRCVDGPPNQLRANEVPLYIGADPLDGRPPYFFRGMLDEVRVWRTVRTAAQIARDLYWEVDSLSTHLAGSWRFNGGVEAIRTTYYDIVRSSSRGAVSYETNGVLPSYSTSPLSVPLEVVSPTLDGQCNPTEYARAERVGKQMGYRPSPSQNFSFPSTVYLLATDTDLWVCMIHFNIRGADTASVTIDLNGSGEQWAQSSDWRFSINTFNEKSTQRGNGSGGWVNASPPGSWDARVAVPSGSEFHFNAEFRIPRSLFGPTFRLALFDRGSSFNNPWPVGLAAPASPASWAMMKFASLSGSPPTHRFEGLVLGDGVGIGEVEVVLYGSNDGGHGELLAQTRTTSSGSFRLSWVGYAPHSFTVAKVNPWGATSIAAEGEGASYALPDVVVYAGRIGGGTYGPSRFYTSFGRSEAGATQFNRHYLIVYDDRISLNALWPLIEAKRLLGYQVRWISAQEIDRTRPGRHRAEKIRNWLKEQWEASRGAPIYALLIGGTEEIPVHDVGWNGPFDHRLPGEAPAIGIDWYYADLDSDWDAGRDGYSGDYLFCPPDQERRPRGGTIRCPPQESPLREGPFGPSGPSSNPDDDWLAEISVGRIQLRSSDEVRRALQAIVDTERSGSLEKRKATLAAAFWGFDGRSWAPGGYLRPGECREVVERRPREEGAWRTEGVEETRTNYCADGQINFEWDGEKPYGHDGAEYIEGDLLPNALRSNLSQFFRLYETTSPGGNPALIPTRFTPESALSAANFDTRWNVHPGPGGLVMVVGHGNQDGVYHSSWVNDWNNNNQIDNPANPEETGPEESRRCRENCYELTSYRPFISSGVISPSRSLQLPLAPVVMAWACSTGSPWLEENGRWSLGADNLPSRLQANGSIAAWLGALNIVPTGGLEPLFREFTRKILGSHLRLGDATWAAMEAQIRVNPYDWRLATPMLFGDPAQSYWGNPADMRAYWPQLGRDWFGSHTTRVSGPIAATRRWVTGIGSPTTAPVVDRRGTIFVGGGTELVMIAPDGSVRARYPFPPSVGSTSHPPVITTDGVYIVAGRTLLEFDVLGRLPANPPVRRQVDLGSAATAAPRVDPDGVVWVPTERGMVRVLGNGQVELLSGGRAHTPATFTPDGKVVWRADSRGYSWEMDRRGNRRESSHPALGSTTTALASGAGNIVYVGHGYSVHAFDLGRNTAITEIWRNLDVAPLGSRVTAPAVQVGLLFVGTSAGDVVALDRRNGRVQWRTSLGWPIEATPAVDGGQVYVAAGDTLFALGATSGRLHWSVSLGGPTDARSTPVIGSNRTVYVTRADNHLVAVGEASLLPIPSEVRVEVGVNQAVIRWRDNSNREAGFAIERCTPAGTCTSLATVPANTTIFTATISTADPFFVRIRAMASRGLGGRSAEEIGIASVDPPGAELDSDYTFSDLVAVLRPAPSAPANPRANARSAEAIEVAWDYTGISPLGFEIERATTPGGPFTTIAVAAPDARRFVDKGLGPGETYHYRVRAYTEGGTSGVVGPVSATTWIPSLPAPTAFRARFSSGQIELSWDDNATNETGYLLERRPPGQANFEVVALLPADTQRYNDTVYLAEASHGVYEYRVKAVASTAESPYATTLVRHPDGDSRPRQFFLPLVSK